MTVEDHVANPDDTAIKAVNRLLAYNEEELYGRLGQLALAAREPGVSVDDLSFQDSASFQELLSFGRRVFQAWSLALHNLICGSDAEASSVRKKLLAAIASKDGSAAAALVAAALSRYMGVDVATAAAIGLLANYVIFKPFGEEFCKFWQSAK